MTLGDRRDGFQLNIVVVQSGEVSREILKHLPVPKGAARELEMGSLQGLE